MGLGLGRLARGGMVLPVTPSRICRDGSHHAEAILSRDHQHAQAVVQQVDSTSVMSKTSTRLADCFEYGLGATVDHAHATCRTSIATTRADAWSCPLVSATKRNRY